MAGSYRHAIDTNGGLLDNENFVQLIENLGDAYEMAEEMYGMIWFLAAGDADLVEEARQRWQEGIALSPGRQENP